MQRAFHDREVINMFRLFIGVRLIIAAISTLMNVFLDRPKLHLFTAPNLLALAEVVLLFIYLSVPWLQQRLRRWYLPVGLAVATIGPVAENLLLQRSIWESINLLQMFAPFAPQDVGRLIIMAGQFQLSVVLLVPLILVSWQYSFRVTLFYIAGLVLLDALPPLLFAHFYPAGIWRVTADVLMRPLAFIFLGYVINRLVSEQKRRNADLAEANRRLASYASTLEQLATSRERNRLAREFHDTLAHTLSAVAVQLEAARALQPGSPAKSAQMLEHSLEMTRNGLNETRRAIQALRAAPLEDLGLRMAVESQARAAAERYNWELQLDVPADIHNLPVESEHAVYRILEEALYNIGQHAGARHVELSLKRSGTCLELALQDDGRGFDHTSLDLQERFGIRGMRERAAEIGAAFAIQSQPGSGTRLTVKLEELV